MDEAWRCQCRSSLKISQDRGIERGLVRGTERAGMCMRQNLEREEHIRRNCDIMDEE